MDEVIKERLLRRLKENAARYWYSNNLDKVMREMYLQDPNGCINEDYLSDDLNKAIFDKFYAVLDAVRQEAGIEGVEIYIDVSHDDSTTYLMVLGDRVLLKGHVKAWNFWWETEEELAEEMYSMYCEVTSWQ